MLLVHLDGDNHMVGYKVQNHVLTALLTQNILSKRDTAFYSKYSKLLSLIF